MQLANVLERLDRIKKLLGKEPHWRMFQDGLMQVKDCREEDPISTCFRTA